MNLTFFKEGQMPLGMIKEVFVNSGHRDLKRVPYANSGINLAPSNDIDHCWSLEKFEGNWPLRANTNKESYEVDENIQIYY